MQNVVLPMYSKFSIVLNIWEKLKGRSQILNCKVVHIITENIHSDFFFYLPVLLK